MYSQAHAYRVASGSAEEKVLKSYTVRTVRQKRVSEEGHSCNAAEVCQQ